jgi:hypothetical protein
MWHVDCETSASELESERLEPMTHLHTSTHQLLQHIAFGFLRPPIGDLHGERYIT